MRVTALMAAILLAGCATTGTAPSPVVPVKIQCLPMVEYSPADQTAFSNEVAGLDPVKHKQVVRFLGDYKAMRDADRACNDGSR